MATGEDLKEDMSDDSDEELRSKQKQELKELRACINRKDSGAKEKCA